MGGNSAVCCGEIVILIVYICTYITFLLVVFIVPRSLYKKTNDVTLIQKIPKQGKVACTLQQMELCANMKYMGL